MRIRDAVQSAFRDNIIDYHFPAPGTGTQPVEGGYMANGWVRLRHPDFDDLRGLMNEVGETVRVRAR